MLLMVVVVTLVLMTMLMIFLLPVLMLVSVFMLLTALMRVLMRVFVRLLGRSTIIGTARLEAVGAGNRVGLGKAGGSCHRYSNSSVAFISGQDCGEQNSVMAPYSKLIWL